MTPKAQHQLLILNALERGEMLMAKAAELLQRSVRQVRRLRQAYRQRGMSALVHGNRGRTSPRRLDETSRQRIVTLAQTRYAGVNHQHLTELLVEREGVHVSRTSLRRILAAAHLRSPRRRRPPRHRQRRERMAQAGVLVQLDGSHHAWLQGRGPRLVLLAAVDDATGHVLSALFRAREDTHGYLLLLRTVARAHGLPVAVYTDRHGIFKRDPRRTLSLREQLDGGPALTQLGRVLRELSITWIPASSPQGKGRVERLFGTFQDRLITELRLRGICDLAAANAFLPRFLTRYNARFAQTAAHPTPAFRPWPSVLDPQTIFCFKYQRRVAHDNTVTLGPRHVQIHPGPHGRSYARALVEVHEHLDGTLAVFYQGHALPINVAPLTAAAALPARPYRRFHLQGPGSVDALRKQRRKERGSSGPWIPPPTHPWKRGPSPQAKRRAAPMGRTESLAP